MTARNANMSKKYRVLSLFSGAGGLDLGIEGGFEYLGEKYKETPFHVVWSNDVNKKATMTQQLNFPNTEVVCGDIVEMLKDPELKLPKNIDVVVGGFPCQDFSLAGKRGGLNVKRGNLYLSMAKVIEMTNPKVFLAENVKGLLSWENGLAIDTITKDFADLGYHVEYRLLNTADYGVPQTRERVIIVGIRNDIKKDIEWAKPTHSSTDSSLKPWVTIGDAIRDIEDENIQLTMYNHGYSKAKFLPGRQGNTITKEDKPAPTMRAEHHGNIEFHYRLPRRLSAREAARIQSFPDNFKFLTSTTDAYRQIGNAVAPVFGWHLAKTIESLLG